MGVVLGIIGILILFFFLGLIVKVVRLFGGVFFSVVADGIGGTIGCIMKLIVIFCIIAAVIGMFGMV